MTSVAPVPQQFNCGSHNHFKYLQVGDEDTRQKRPTKSSYRRVKKHEAASDKSPRPRSPYLGKAFLQRVSTGLSFSKDVVKDRCKHTLPYDMKYFYEALDPSDVLPNQRKETTDFGRHNPRGPDTKHLPCHIKKRSTHKLKPIKRSIQDRAKEMHDEAVRANEKIEAERAMLISAELVRSELTTQGMLILFMGKTQFF